MEADSGCEGERGPHSFPEKPEDGQENEMPCSSHDKCSYLSYLASKKHASFQERDLSGAKHIEGH